jgi:hypothetical protein
MILALGHAPGSTGWLQSKAMMLPKQLNALPGSIAIPTFAVCEQTHANHGFLRASLAFPFDVVALPMMR